MAHRTIRNSTAAALVAACLAHGIARADVILAWYEGSWQTIERRMPDVFVAGDDAIWVPPPGKADSGGFSVGYDVYDRFNLGNPFDRTLYGTTQGFLRMSREMDQSDTLLYVDSILNHNGFRDLSTPGFVAAGDYPGFVCTLPGDIDGDFHGSFEGGDLNGRLAGLNDIAQEKNHVFVRHPIPGSPNPIPNETPRAENARLYPDTGLAQQFGRHPFNLANPDAGDPVPENATGLLLRYTQWMVEVCGADGFRLDAVKHVPTFFWNDFYDATLFNAGRNPRDNSAFTPFSFGENFTGDFGSLGAYTRKDGYGNRDVLDFPLFFAMRGVFDAGGFGDMRAIPNASFDGSDGDPNDGSRGVLFAGSHDEFGPGYFNGYNNLAQAHVLTRSGYPVVYYNAKEFGDNRDFPKDGRADALGNQTGYGTFDPTILLDLVRINDTHGRGPYANRWVDEDVYVYERQNACLIGINDRGDAGFDTRTVQTAFAGGTVLVELTGNAVDAGVDPGNVDIFDTVTVAGDGKATIRVPRNSSASGFHGKGYVVYGPAVPAATLAIANQASTIAPDGSGVPHARRRLTALPVVTADTINVTLTVGGTAPNDNALLKLNTGVDLDGDLNVNPGGFLAGFESFDSHVGSVYATAIDATGLAEGYQYIETVAFLQRPGGSPTLYDVDRAVVYLDRVPPEVDLLFPGQTGNSDIVSRSYEAVVATDRTANAVHVLLDAPAADPDAIALASDANKARQHDRLEWRHVLNNIAAGMHEICVVAFEESGNVSVTRFGGIQAVISYPEIAIGIDTDASAGAVNFQPFPGTVNSSAMPEEIVVRVNTQTTPGGAISFADGDFDVTLAVDGGTPLEAVGYDAGLLPPIGRLVQNDQNLGDDWDEFRFVWRGYGKGNHSFVARAELTSAAHPPNEALATTNVPDSVTGPAITITKPLPPGETVNNPAEIEVAGTFGGDPAFAQVFLDSGGDSLLLETLNDPPAGAFSVVRDVASYAFLDLLPPNAIQTENGTFTVRVVASTGPNGSGIVSEASSELTIEGQSVPEPLAPFLPDGDATEMLALPALAVSAADGPGVANPTDFGEDGTLTELRAGIRDNVLGIALRGSMFGAAETNLGNASFVFVDVNAGSAQGVLNVATNLTDESDGLRGDISRAGFIVGGGANDRPDLAVGMTAPTIAYGYSFGTDGLGGSFANFQFQDGIVASYDDDTAGFPAAQGTTLAGPDTFEIRIPMATLGNVDPYELRFMAGTASDAGFPSPNTLPENTSNAFDPSQTWDTVALFPGTPSIRINEIVVGVPDAIELYNPNAFLVNLAGWALRMNDSGNVPRDYSFPSGTTIPANGFLVVSDQGGSTPPSPVAGYAFAGFNVPWHDERGGSVALVDQYGIGKDYVDWRNKTNDEASDPARAVPAGTTFAGSVTGPDSSVHSLGRDQNGTDTNAAADWENTSGVHASSPTLGAPNVNQAAQSSVWMLR